MRPVMSCELPQCSHVLLGMDNYSPLRQFMISPYRFKRVLYGNGAKFPKTRLLRGIINSLRDSNGPALAEVSAIP